MIIVIQETPIHFINGILAFFIDVKTFPRKLINATLGSEIPNLIRQFSQIPTNEKLFATKKKEAFLEIHHMTHPDNMDIDNDYSYNITPYSFEDANCFIYAVSYGKQVRIFASDLEYKIKEVIYEPDDTAITEAYISTDNIAEFISKLNTQLSQQILLNKSYKT